MNSICISSYKKTVDLYQSLKILKASVFWGCNFLPYLRSDDFLLEKTEPRWFPKTFCYNWRYSKCEAIFTIKEKPWNGGGEGTLLSLLLLFYTNITFWACQRKNNAQKPVIREATMKSWETAKQLSYELGTPAKSLPPTICSQTNS